MKMPLNISNQTVNTLEDIIRQSDLEELERLQEDYSTEETYHGYLLARVFERKRSLLMDLLNLKLKNICTNIENNKLDNITNIYSEISEIKDNILKTWEKIKTKPQTELYKKAVNDLQNTVNDKLAQVEDDLKISFLFIDLEQLERLQETYSKEETSNPYPLAIVFERKCSLLMDLLNLKLKNICTNIKNDRLDNITELYSGISEIKDNILKTCEKIETKAEKEFYTKAVNDLANTENYLLAKSFEEIKDKFTEIFNTIENKDNNDLINNLKNYRDLYIHILLEIKNINAYSNNFSILEKYYRELYNISAKNSDQAKLFENIKKTFNTELEKFINDPANESKLPKLKEFYNPITSNFYTTLHVVRLYTPTLSLNKEVTELLNNKTNELEQKKELLKFAKETLSNFREVPSNILVTIFKKLSSLFNTKRRDHDEFVSNLKNNPSITYDCFIEKLVQKNQEIETKENNVFRSQLKNTIEEILKNHKTFVEKGEGEEENKPRDPISRT